ncbi:hypothetical protein FQR65_LT20429 [Abscondita terminalis]|nr:hypothetical protein FQR65_LT20429 [Abscondita terminalis]
MEDGLECSRIPRRPGAVYAPDFPASPHRGVHSQDRLSAYFNRPGSDAAGSFHLTRGREKARSAWSTLRAQQKSPSRRSAAAPVLAQDRGAGRIFSEDVMGLGGSRSRANPAEALRDEDGVSDSEGCLPGRRGPGFAADRHPPPPWANQGQDEEQPVAREDAALGQQGGVDRAGQHDGEDHQAPKRAREEVALDPQRPLCTGCVTPGEPGANQAFRGATRRAACWAGAAAWTAAPGTPGKLRLGRTDSTELQLRALCAPAPGSRAVPARTARNAARTKASTTCGNCFAARGLGDCGTCGRRCCGTQPGHLALPRACPLSLCWGACAGTAVQMVFQAYSPVAGARDGAGPRRSLEHFTNPDGGRCRAARGASSASTSKSWLTARAVKAATRQEAYGCFSFHQTPVDEPAEHARVSATRLNIQMRMAALSSIWKRPESWRRDRLSSYRGYARLPKGCGMVASAQFLAEGPVASRGRRRAAHFWPGRATKVAASIEGAHKSFLMQPRKALRTGMRLVRTLGHGTLEQDQAGGDPAGRLMASAQAAGDQFGSAAGRLLHPARQSRHRHPGPGGVGSLRDAAQALLDEPPSRTCRAGQHLAACCHADLSGAGRARVPSSPIRRPSDVSLVRKRMEISSPVSPSGTWPAGLPPVQVAVGGNPVSARAPGWRCQASVPRRGSLRGWQAAKARTDLGPAVAAGQPSCDRSPRCPGCPDVAEGHVTAGLQGQDGFDTGVFDAQRP